MNKLEARKDVRVPQAQLKPDSFSFPPPLMIPAPPPQSPQNDANPIFEENQNEEDQSAASQSFSSHRESTPAGKTLNTNIRQKIWEISLNSVIQEHLDNKWRTFKSVKVKRIKRFLVQKGIQISNLSLLFFLWDCRIWKWSFRKCFGFWRRKGEWHESRQRE